MQLHSFASLELQFWWLSKRKRVLPMLWDGRDSPQTYCRKSDINQIHIWLTACSQYLVCKWIATNATRASYSSIVHFFCAAAAEQKILVQARRNMWGRLGFGPNKFLSNVVSLDPVSFEKSVHCIIVLELFYDNICILMLLVPTKFQIVPTGL